MQPVRAAAVAAFLTVSLLVPPGHAGDASNPEISDAASDAGAAAAWGDITAGWFNDTATDIVMTLQLAQLTPQAPPGYTWFVVADVAGASYGWGANIDQGGPAFFYSVWERNGAGPTDFQAGSGSVSAGTPGTITANLPKSYTANATTGDALTSIIASSGQVNFPVTLVPVPTPLPLPFYQELDGATGSDYTLAFGAPPAPPTPGNGTGNTTNQTQPPPPAPAPGFEAALAAGALLLVAEAVRRRRA
jgi:hypothetical protein